MKLHINEACLIVDALNGIRCSDGIPMQSHLEMNIACAIDMDRLDAKWNVNSETLIERLAVLSEEQAGEVLEKVKAFWDKSPHACIETGLRKAGFDEMFLEADEEVPDEAWYQEVQVAVD